MPVARYFLFVGGVLLALLFFADAYVPKAAVAENVGTPVDRSVVRIHSDQKWPERIVFDTSLPTIVPAPVVANITTPAPVVSPVAEISAKARVRESFAQFSAAEPKKPGTPVQHKRKVAKNRTAPPMMLVAQQPRFGFFGNDTW